MNVLVRKLNRRSMDLKWNASLVIVRGLYRDIVEESNNRSLPVITTPLKLLRKTKKLRERKLLALNRLEETYGVDRRHGRLIISCPKKSDNHYARQRYPPNRPLLLGSEFWKSTKHAGETITINQREKARRVFFNDDDDDDETLTDSFDAFNLSYELKTVLNRSFDRPTEVQSLAIPKLLAGVNGIVAAETGSGKTLAYLVPVVQKLVDLRMQLGPPSPRSPRAVVFVPNLELASQIFDVLQTLIADTSLCAARVTSNYYYPTALDQPQDIIVATPGRLAKFKRLNAVDLSSLRHVVIDEADTLLDATFRNIMFDILGDVRFDRGDNRKSAQLILCSATFFDYVDEFLTGLNGLEATGFERITTSHLHMLQPHIVHRFVRLIKPALPERLLYLVKADLKADRPCIVFVKNVAQGWFVNRFLSEQNGVPCGFLYRDLHSNRQHNCEKILHDFRHGAVKLLISTNLGSRGLDTPNTRHVINYDFPKTMADYLHRAGRLARAGSVDQSGFLVTSFVYDKASAQMIRQIETAVRTDSPLKNIFVNIRTEYYKQHKANKEPKFADVKDPALQ